MKSYFLKIQCFGLMYELFNFMLIFWVLLLRIIGIFFVNVWLEWKIKSYQSNFDLIFHKQLQTTMKGLVIGAKYFEKSIYTKEVFARLHFILALVIRSLRCKWNLSQFSVLSNNFLVWLMSERKFNNSQFLFANIPL